MAVDCVRLACIHPCRLAQTALPAYISNVAGPGLEALCQKAVPPSAFGTGRGAAMNISKSFNSFDLAQFGMDTTLIHSQGVRSYRKQKEKGQGAEPASGRTGRWLHTWLHNCARTWLLRPRAPPHRSL